MLRSQILERGSTPKDTDQRNNLENMIGKDSDMDSQPCIINKIIKELEHEDIEGIDDKKMINSLNSGKVLVNLGIQKNQVGLSSPNFGKEKGKRGRRSLKDLREVEGLGREQ